MVPKDQPALGVAKPWAPFSTVAVPTPSMKYSAQTRARNPWWMFSRGLRVSS